MSGSNRTPCCEQPRAVRRSDIMTEGSVTGHWLFPSKFIRLIDIWWDNGQITIANTIVVNYILHVVIKYINRVAVIEYITNDKLLVTITYFICVLTIISEHDQSQSFENNKNVFEPRPHPLSDGTQCSGCDIKPVKQWHACIYNVTLSSTPSVTPGVWQYPLDIPPRSVSHVHRFSITYDKVTWVRKILFQSLQWKY